MIRLKQDNLLKNEDFMFYGDLFFNRPMVFFGSFQQIEEEILQNMLGSDLINMEDETFLNPTSFSNICETNSSGPISSFELSKNEKIGLYLHWFES